MYKRFYTKSVKEFYTKNVITKNVKKFAGKYSGACSALLPLWGIKKF